MTKEQILHEALSLSQSDRDDLAEQLRQSLREGEFSSSDIDKFRRRVAAVASGEMKTHDGEQVMRELFEMFSRAKAG